MAGGTFSFEGLDELKTDIEKCLKLYPDETEKEVYRLAGVFIKDVNAKMPGDYSGGKPPIPEGWHRTREKASFGGYTVGVEIENKHPIWHLVENGHVVKADPKMFAALESGGLDKSKRQKKARGQKNPNVKVLGYSPGRHYCERTRQEWQNEWPGHVEKYVDKMLKGHNL